MSPLQFFFRVCGLIATVILVPLAIWGCDSGGLGGSGDEVTNHYNTSINCTQTITVEMTQSDFDAAVESGQPLEALSVTESPSGQTTVTASQCLNVGNEPAEV